MIRALPICPTIDEFAAPELRLSDAHMFYVCS
jgi:hypothetical protein